MQSDIWVKFMRISLRLGNTSNRVVTRSFDRGF
jgi:hypothetical protein